MRKLIISCLSRNFVFSITCAAFLIGLSGALNAQSVGIGTNSPNSNAALDVSSANKGILIPRGDAVFRSGLNSNTAKGLMMFDTVTNTLWVHSGNGLAGGWRELSNPRVSFFEFATAGQVMTTSYTQINFLLEDYDDGNNASTSGFVAPASGIYHFEARAVWNPLGAVNQTVSLAFFNSGFSTSVPVNEVHIPATSGVSSEIFTASISANLKLNAGDVVTVWGKQSTATGGGIVNASSQKHYFQGNRVY